MPTALCQPWHDLLTVTFLLSLHSQDNFMEVLNIISAIGFVAMSVYIVCFLLKFRFIPQSLSITAEYSGRYTWWKITICTVMGWLSFWFPTVYPFAEYSYWAILPSIGVLGLALAGYYSYHPGDETKLELAVHKTGSFIGSACVCLFYIIALEQDFVWIILGVGLVLGLLIRGKRLDFPDSNSVLFWEEIGIIFIIQYDVVTRILSLLE